MRNSGIRPSVRGRDDFPESVKRALAFAVGCLCSRPDCRCLTTAASAAQGEIINLGVAAHITGAARGGARFEALLTRDERRSYENGIWLCQSCAKLIDSDEATYSVPVLRGWKASAEKEALERLTSGQPVRVEDCPLRFGHLDLPGILGELEAQGFDTHYALVSDLDAKLRSGWLQARDAATGRPIHVTFESGPIREEHAVFVRAKRGR